MAVIDLEQLSLVIWMGATTGVGEKVDGRKSGCVI